MGWSTGSARIWTSLQRIRNGWTTSHGRYARDWKNAVGTSRALETDPLSARLIVTLWRPPVKTEHGLVLSLEDVVGTKVRALADRGLARDLIDVRAAADRWSNTELETLGRRHARDSFDLDDLQARLTGIDWIDDAEFAAYGLDEAATAELRRWA